MRSWLAAAPALAVLALASAATAPERAGGPTPARSVALTFDDLPGTPPALPVYDTPALRAMTERLLAALRAERAPAIGFVNEGQLCAPGAPAAEAAARIELLELWLEAGFELGNHGYAHLDLNHTPLEVYQDDVLRGEIVTRRLLARRARVPQYFRHPFLHAGRDLDTRRAFEAFLVARGYRSAPVTLDSDEYIYAAAYAAAARRADTALAERLAQDYLRYMDEVCERGERSSRALFGREIAQVLLLHANALNADVFPRLAQRLRARGYRFVTLAEALRDPAYTHHDTYAGAQGLSWLQRWELSAGRVRSAGAELPGWVRQAFEARGQP